MDIVLKRKRNGLPESLSISGNIPPTIPIIQMVSAWIRFKLNIAIPIPAILDPDTMLVDKCALKLAIVHQKIKNYPIY